MPHRARIYTILDAPVQFGGALRTMVGTNVTHIDLHDYTGQSTNATDANGNTAQAVEAQTLLARDCAAGLIVGCNGGWDRQDSVS